MQTTLFSKSKNYVSQAVSVRAGGFFCGAALCGAADDDRTARILEVGRGCSILSQLFRCGTARLIACTLLSENSIILTLRNIFESIKVYSITLLELL